ncbi:chromosome condensation complex Condensin [Encephalitozoon romaleae SJ-2008]|uniref:Condensin complex subunit 2 n=1 Tax=Encephalitozoon romaleae (strain SJ-2008) TaxID=1178016 RepID=I7ADC0_ENCRO|nr:chromosome condensation complex Condensin [Encephalitozoon romaleae SJ-2008]AFN82595.1 chromosome condensation complex Condensin [Encephalitozoon romaleae SJ-2008]
MSADDLRTWLKAAAENKITTKNTWRSTLIDHFTNIDEFREKQGINFQKASCTLDGCAKVYSTRVDDVSENAVRLLEGFGREESKKKQSRKQTKTTIEKNIFNLNIKVNASRKSVDPKFLYLTSLPENVLMIDAVGISSDGVLRMSSSKDGKVIIIDDHLKLPISFPKGLLISPSISEDKEIEKMIIEPMADNDQEDSREFAGLDTDRNFDLSEIPLINDNQNFGYKEASVSHFKGWAGPNHWKIQAKKGRNGSQKPKETSFLDFTEVIDHESITEPGNTLFDPSFIVERRENRHILPQDFRLDVEDLYKYLIRDGSFYGKDQRCEDEAIDYSPSSCVMEEPEDEFIADIPLQGIQKNPIPFRKTSKKVNIKKLKDNVFDSVMMGNTTLLSIFESVPKIYGDDESKDISVHLCFISLLHLANDNNIQLKGVGNDVEVCILSKPGASG